MGDTFIQPIDPGGVNVIGGPVAVIPQPPATEAALPEPSPSVVSTSSVAISIGIG